MAEETKLTLSLQPGGRDVENNNYRTRDKYKGQIERADVYDEGKSLNLQMNLAEVIHGTMDGTKGSPPGTLIIADFKFISNDPSRRFQQATIELRFRGIDMDDLSPPEVLGIAPLGSWGLQKTEKVQEVRRAAKVDVGATFVANVSTGMEWSINTTQTQSSEATVTGMCTKRGRKTEPKNAAVWSMSENEDIEKGIPSLLRTAILLKRQSDDNFYCYIAVDTKVNWRPKGLSPSIESRKAGGDTDHVLFSPKKKRTEAPLAGINPSKLRSVVLTGLMAVTTKESIAPPLPATTITDGQYTDLASENVIHDTQKSEEHVLKVEQSVVESDDTLVSGLKAEEPILSNTPMRAEEPQQVPVSTAREPLSNHPNQTDPHPVPSVILGNGSHIRHKTDDSIPKSADAVGSLPPGLNLEVGSNLEETLRLLLHAVRKGVEVIAEANRISLEPWPEQRSEQ